MTNQQIAFCLECNCYQPYSVKTEKISTEIKGLRFSYVKAQAYCAKCGKPVYTPEINDANVQAREEGYRKIFEGIFNVTP